MSEPKFVAFFVPVRPAPKGSWKPVSIPKAGKHGSVYRADFVTRLLPDNRKSEPFKKAVMLFARQAWKGATIPKGTAVSIKIAFMFRRPKCHFGTTGGKPDPAKLRADAPRFPLSEGEYGDADKLLRNVLDALTGIVYDDDAQVVQAVPRKVFGDQDGAMVTVNDVESIEELDG